MERLEARYKQEIGQLQERHNRLQDSHRANVIEHLQRIHVRVACRRALSSWKTAAIRSLLQPKQTAIEMVDEGTGPPSPSAMGDNRAALQAELDRLQAQLKYVFRVANIAT